MKKKFIFISLLMFSGGSGFNFQGLFNTTSSNTPIQSAIFTDITVTESANFQNSTVDFTAATISGFNAVDNISIEFANHELSVKDNGIQTDKIADAAVTDIKINTVDASKITGPNMSIDNITGRTTEAIVNINNINITEGKLSNNQGLYETVKINNLHVTDAYTPGNLGVDVFSSLVTDYNKSIYFPNADGTLVVDQSDVTFNTVTTNDAVTAIGGVFLDAMRGHSTNIKLLDTTNSSKRVEFDISNQSTLYTPVIQYPTASGTLALISDIPGDTAQFMDTNFAVYDNTYPDRRVAFQCAGLTSGLTTLTVPDGNATILTNNSSSLVTNKSIRADQNYFVSNTDEKKLYFDCDGITASTTRTLSVPDASGTIVLADNVQTLSNKNLSSTTTYIADTTNPLKTARFDCSGLLASADRVYTFPNGDGTFVLETRQQILTNKTLSNPVLTSINNLMGGYVYIPSPTTDDTVVLRNATETLTNKTLTAPSIDSITSTGVLSLPRSSFQAGNTLYPSISLATGVLLTTPQAGAIEYDSNAFYTTNNDGRQVAGFSYTLGGLNTLGDTGAVQNLFPSTRDVFTLGSGKKYFIEAYFLITRTSGTTSRTISFSFTGTASGLLSNVNILCTASNPTSNALSTPQQIVITGAAGAVLTAASTSASENIRVHMVGHLQTSGSGTLIPSVKYSAAPGGTSTLQNGSFFKFTCLGDTANVSIGPWS